MAIIVVYAVLLICFVLAISIGVPWYQSLYLATAKVTPIPQEAEDNIFQASSSVVDEATLIAMGFHRDGAYLFDAGIAKATFAMWRHGADASYFAAYRLENTESSKWYLDVVSILSRDPQVCVTTSNSKAGHVLASIPGSYSQTFDGQTISALWHYHINAEAFASERHAITPQPIEMNGGQSLEWSTRLACAYRNTHPWLFLKTPWRYFIGQHLRHNKTIAELYG